jgi:hypothetical protein
MGIAQRNPSKHRLLVMGFARAQPILRAFGRVDETSAFFVTPGLLRSARNDDEMLAKISPRSLRGALAPKQSSPSAQNAWKKLLLINASSICFFFSVPDCAGGTRYSRDPRAPSGLQSILASLARGPYF